MEAAGTPTLLGVLLTLHDNLRFAERNITFQTGRLRQLAAEERDIGSFDVGHILDCAQRLNAAVTARDVHLKTLDALTQSLRRTEPVPPARTAAPVPGPASRSARSH